MGVSLAVRDAKTGVLARKPLVSSKQIYVPTEEKFLKPIRDEGITLQGWRHRWLPVRVESSPKSLRVWFDGRLVANISDPAVSKGGIEIQLSQGDRLSPPRRDSERGGAPFVRAGGLKRLLQQLCDVGPGRWLADQEGEPASGRFADRVGWRPAEHRDGAEQIDNLSLVHAQWPEWKSDPEWGGSYYAQPLFASDPRTPVLRVPNEAYSAVYLLAAADSTSKASHVVSFRMSVPGKACYYDSAATVPCWTETNARTLSPPCR